MPKKPTNPFGYVAFAKDGSVKEHIESPPDIKSSQEEEIGQRFARGLELAKGEAFICEPCEENDHDFTLNKSIPVQASILVQATEIVSRDYLRPIEFDDYLNGRHSFKSSVSLGSKTMFGVDEVAKEEVLLNRIMNKLGKNYSKPTKPLWLLVWTVSDYFPFWSEGGRSQVSGSVLMAQEYLSKNGTGPFDEIWFFRPDLRPNRIWPSIE